MQCSPVLCAIYDEGGKLVICDGSCLRHFHLHEDEGTCPGVRVPPGDTLWVCPDCAAQKATCFKCGKLGDMHVQVRKCLLPLCQRWYCLHCLPLGSRRCPIHHCAVCQQNYDSESMTDAVQCLRCPTSWHKDCLDHIQARNVIETVWGPNRPPWQHEAQGQIHWMVYCPAHPLHRDTGLADHTHISWL